MPGRHGPSRRPKSPRTSQRLQRWQTTWSRRFAWTAVYQSSPGSRWGVQPLTGSATAPEFRGLAPTGWRSSDRHRFDHTRRKKLFRAVDRSNDPPPFDHAEPCEDTATDPKSAVERTVYPSSSANFLSPRSAVRLECLSTWCTRKYDVDIASVFGWRRSRPRCSRFLTLAPLVMRSPPCSSNPPCPVSRPLSVS